ncbi:Peptidylprolyl isomerase [Micromonospora saelicesensis]|nr:Peptidylprolyl isomerase [Micromonospora saelicesensis]
MPGYAPPGYPPQYPGYGYPQPPKTNGMAIAAFVLALIGFTSCITAPIGAILGHVAQKQIRLSGEGGAGMAKAAIIVGWILTGFLVLVIAIYAAAIIYAIATSDNSSSSSY